MLSLLRTLYRTLSLILMVYLWAGSPVSADSSSLAGRVIPRDQYPLSSLHLGLRPRRHQDFVEGKFETSTTFAWSSTNAQRESYRVDAETREVEFGLHYGVTDSFSIAAFVPLVWRGGGVLDPVIDGWHDFFSLPQGGRNDVPDNEYFIAGRREDGGIFRLKRDGLGVSNPVVQANLLLLEDAKHTSTVVSDFNLSLPGATEGYGHDGIDLSTGLRGVTAVDDFGFALEAALFYAQKPEVENIPFQRFWVEGAATVSYTGFLPEVYLALLGGSERVENVAKHPSHTLYLDVGLHWLLSESVQLTTAFRENPSAGKGSADFGIYSVLSISLS